VSLHLLYLAACRGSQATALTHAVGGDGQAASSIDAIIVR